ncbi:glycosyltransferase family 9 protein [bacterium]|nr:glycosyltransferase family 9 protein [bacterium]
MSAEAEYSKYENIVKNAKNIAVIRLDGLGDSLLAQPAVKHLIKSCPQAQITVLGSPLGAPVFYDLCPTKVINTGNHKEGALQISAVLKEIDPEIILCFTEKGYALRAVGRFRKSLRIGFFPGLSQPLKSLALLYQLSERVFFDNNPRKPQKIHEVERFFLLLDRLGLPRPEAAGAAELQISGALELEAEKNIRLLAEQSAEGAGIKAEAERIAHPAAIQLMPRWNPEIDRLRQDLQELTLSEAEAKELLKEYLQPIEELCRFLQSKNMPFVFSCAPPDRGWAQIFTRSLQAFSNVPDPLPLFCSGELHEFAAFLQQASFLITPDGGAAHAAAAVKTPSAVIFPEKNLENCLNRWHPWQSEYKVIVRQGNRADNINFTEKLKEACKEYVDRNQRSNSHL